MTQKLVEWHTVRARSPEAQRKSPSSPQRQNTLGGRQTPLQMMRHLQRKRVSANSQVVTTLPRCAQALHAQKDAGSASGPSGPLTKPRKPVECFLAQRVISRGETHVCQPSGREKHRAWSRVLGRSGPSRVACHAATRSRALSAFRTSLRHCTPWRSHGLA